MIALLFAFPFITLLQRSLRHARLVEDSRLDAKTGLLNAVTWERQATTELTRMMNDLREFQFASQILQSESDRQQAAIDKITTKRT